MSLGTGIRPIDERAEALLAESFDLSPSGSTPTVEHAYEGAPVRHVLIDGEPWFVLLDVCRVLEVYPFVY